MRRRACLLAALAQAIVFLPAYAATLASSEIPLEFQEGLLWLKASVPQSPRPLNLLLDTGAAASVLNLPVAKELKLQLGKPIRVRGVKCDLTGYAVHNLTAVAQTIPLPADYIALDLSALSSSCARPVDGLVGADFFRHRIVQLDFQAGKLRLLSAAPPSENPNALPLQSRPCGMRVPATVNGHTRQWLRLDTGCATPLQWVNATVATTQCSTRVAIGLAEMAIPQTETTVQLGGSHFEKVPTGIHASPIFSGESGLLGNGLLSRFSRVTIDAHNGKLYFDPLPGPH